MDCGLQLATCLLSNIALGSVYTCTIPDPLACVCVCVGGCVGVCVCVCVCVGGAHQDQPLVSGTHSADRIIRYLHTQYVQ